MYLTAFSLTSAQRNGDDDLQDLVSQALLDGVLKDIQARSSEVVRGAAPGVLSALRRSPAPPGRAR